MKWKIICIIVTIVIFISSFIILESMTRKEIVKEIEIDELSFELVGDKVLVECNDLKPYNGTLYYSDYTYIDGNGYSIRMESTEELTMDYKVHYINHSNDSYFFAFKSHISRENITVKGIVKEHCNTWDEPVGVYVEVIEWH